MEICEISQCTGCEMCAGICAVKAISMQPDEKGFLRPYINFSACVNCGMCRKLCPQNHDIPKKQGEIYAAVSLNDRIRAESSSGGIFSAAAQWILEQGGVVFGAAYDENMAVVHTEATTLSELSRLRGSKYVQSRIGQTYVQVKEYLDNGRWVLFSGTPCQIAGLRACLHRNYSHLLCVDILCHGVPSQTVFRKYVDALENKFTKTLTDVRFRSKKTGWRHFSTELVFSDGQKKVLEQDGYMTGYLKNLYLRECCYQCRYASHDRVGDITLGDYWGYQAHFPNYLLDDDHGVSLVIINTEQGRKVFNKIRSKIAVVPRTITDAQQENKILKTAFPKPENTEKFWKDFGLMSWNDLSQRYFLIQDGYREKRIFNHDEKYIPYKIKNRNFVVRCWIAGIWRKLRGK